MRFVIFEAARIDDAAILEGEPRLALEPGIVVDDADAETVRLAVEHAGIEQRIDIARLDRPVADPAFVGRHFDQRLQPIHAARAGADDLDIEAALLEGFAEAMRDFFGADAERAGIAGDEDARAHACASFTSWSSFASSSMPNTCLSSMAAGEEWQSPRQ